MKGTISRLRARPYRPAMEVHRTVAVVHGHGPEIDLRAELLGGQWVLRARRDTEAGRELHLKRALRGLSEQQSRILARAALGASGKEIAIELGVGESTVSIHLASALEHLQLTRSEVGALLGGRCRVEVVTTAPGRDDGLIVRPEAGASLAQRLTSAELAVLSMVFEGRSNREIARARQRSARTIANQLAASFRKLQVASRGELFARWGPPTAGI
jgi:DNA-binding NarL/FixJ family response regulator